MSTTRHGRARTFPTIPCPYASPKCLNDAGETTSTSTPRPRTCSTASATKRPAGSSGERGYDVVSTTTFTRETYALADAAGRMTGVQRAVAAVPLVLVPALGATQGGFQPDAWVWAGAIAAWGSAIALVVATSPGALRRAWPWLAASVALLLWTLASILWSAHAAQSLLEARRTLLYVAVVLALLLLARRDAPRLLVPATHVAISGLLVYALARYLLSARRRDPFELYDLNQPLGYANAAGILAVLAILLALGLVAEATAAPLRIGAAATVPLLAGTLVLTQSNASDLALGVGLAAVALLTPHLVRFLAALAVVGPAAAVAAALAAVSRLTADTP